MMTMSHNEDETMFNPNKGSLFDVFIFCIVTAAFIFAICKEFSPRDVKDDCREAWDNNEACYVKR
jgi:hypothetical protein